MITADDFFTGSDGTRRDIVYASELTPEIVAAADVTVGRWNLLLTRFYAENPNAPRRRVASGWRPRAINAATPGAATNSTHLIGEALDGSDADRLLARWILANELESKRLAVASYAAEIGLWFEDFRTTPTWVHGQSVPPHSGLRIYIPSNEWWLRLKDDTLSLDDLKTPLELSHLT